MHCKHLEIILLHFRATIYLKLVGILKLMPPPLQEVTHTPSPASLLCPPGVGMCSGLSTLKMWPGRKTFQEALNLDKKSLKLRDLSLPLTPPSPPPPPVGMASPQAGGAQPRTLLCSGPGYPPLLPAPSSGWSMSREPWSSGKVF